MMKRFLTRYLCLGLLWLGGAVLATAADPKIYKVLPHLLDDKGRHALSPSLYERDAYQALLRKQPEKVQGLRFDVNWRTPSSITGPLTLRLELRTANRPMVSPVVLETSVKPGFFGRKWNALAVNGDQYREMGSVLAWRATLLEGGREIAVKTSFLW